MTLYILAAAPGRDAQGEQNDWCQAEIRSAEALPAPLPETGGGKRPFVWKIGDDIAAAQAYIVELWAAVSTVYERDLQVKLWVPYA